MKQFFLLIVFSFQFVTAQSFTGGIKVVTQYTAYDNNSMVLGDSITDPNYSVSTEVPGFREYITFNTFGRLWDGNSSLIIEATNDTWTPLMDYPEQNIRRFTFDWSNNQFMFTLGDIYKNGNDVFIASRPIRGLRFTNKNDIDVNRWRYDVYGGEFEKALNYQQPLPQQYNYFETGGVFQRLGGAFEVTKNWNGFIETKIEGIYGKDIENSIDKSTVKPLESYVLGGEVNSFFLGGKISVGGGYWYSSLDSLPFQTIQEESILGTEDNPESSLDSLTSAHGQDYTVKFWIRYKDEKSKFDLQLYRIGTNYYTVGNPYLLGDRFGGLFTSYYEFTNWFSASFDAEYFLNNLDDSPVYPQSKTQRIVPRLIFKYGLLEFAVGYPYQAELSDKILQELVPTIFDRSTTGPEIEFSYNAGSYSVTYAAYFSNVDENSIIYGDSLFSNSQNIHNLNLFFTNDRYFISLGAAASFFDGGSYTSGFKNYGVYGNLRYQIVPQIFVVEANLSWQTNDVDYINIWEKIGGFNNITSGAFFEYFFSTNLSFKAGLDYISKDYNYTSEDVNDILSIPGFDYTYFLGQEDVQILRPHIEINILF